MNRFWLLVLAFPSVLAAQERSFRWTNRHVLGTELHLSAGLTFADVDGDGDMDALVANGRHWPQPNEVYLNNGAARFTVSYQLGSRSATTYAVAAGDLDGDGDVDVVVANDMAENWVYLNDGTGRFAPAWPVGPEIEPTRSEFGEPQGSTIAVAVGDVDGDGDPDLVLANRDGQANQVLFNDGRLGFARNRSYGTGSDETRSVVLADLNGDGFLDIVNANIGEPNRIYLGDGSGGFDRGTSVGGSEESYALVVLDVDRDGDIDVVVANVRGRNELYLNDGSGMTWVRVPIGEESYVTYGLAAADLNGDGFADLGFANSGGPNLIFLNVEAGSRRD